MKIKILITSLVIILLTIFASSCDKTGSSSSSGGGGNATNLALTNANITGTWLGTNGTDTIISKINFSNNVDYVFTMSDGYEIEGTYTILDSNSIKLANGIEDTLIVSLLSSTNFNFNFGDGNVFYTIREVDPNAPTCSITSPSNGADLLKGNSVAISVNANSASGIIADVKIYVNNVLKSTLTSSPYTYNWETSAEALGNKTIKAIATDDSGNEKTSEITITLSESTTNFPLTNANIAGDWLGTNGTDTLLTRMNFSNNVDYIFTMLGGYEVEGTYIILDDNKIKLMGGIEDTLVVVLLSSTNFNFNSKFNSFVPGTSVTSYSIREIDNGSSVAAFVASPTGVESGESIQFTDNSSNNPVSWLWDFGDGTTSTIQNPTHTYIIPESSSRNYDISLTAINENGGNTITKQGYIFVIHNPPAVEVNFSASPTTIFLGDAVNFTLIISGAYNNIDWDFGDGNTYSGFDNPTHTYNAIGDYTVSVHAYGAVGEDTETKINYIQVK